MKMTITTPALLFPAISLLMLSYNGRFLALANLVRQLHASKEREDKQILLGQIDNLIKRLSLIKMMQICGIVSFIFCTVSMFLLFIDNVLLGEVLFGFSLLSLLMSLVLSLCELSISTAAINIRLKDLKDFQKEL